MGWSGSKVFCGKDLLPHEHFYGFGEDREIYDEQASLDQQGRLITMDNQGPPTDRDHWTDMGIPFFISIGSPGGSYGLFFDNTYKSYFNMVKGSSNYYYWWSEGGELDYYFIYGPSIKEILDKYTALTSKPPMPPLWVLGFLQSRWPGFGAKHDYNNWSKVNRVADTFRSKGIPCDALILDCQWINSTFDMEWSKSFSNPKLNLDKLENKGIKIIVITDPGVLPGCSNYEEGDTNKYFSTDSKGKTKLFNLTFKSKCVSLLLERS
jgi:alpha-glucosidase